MIDVAAIDHDARGNRRQDSAHEHDRRRANIEGDRAAAAALGQRNFGSKLVGPAVIAGIGYHLIGGEYIRGSDEHEPDDDDSGETNWRERNRGISLKSLGLKLSAVNFSQDPRPPERDLTTFLLPNRRESA